jgi:hypothetical protein
MNTLPKASILAIILLTVACQSGKDTAATSDTTAVEQPASTPTTATAPTPTSERLHMKLSHDDNKKVEARLGETLMLSITLPDSGKWDFSTEGDNYISGEWEVDNNVLDHRSVTFSVGNSPCYYPSDEGTSTEMLEPLMGELQFNHGTFDNRASGTSGVQEFYDVYMKEAYCVRFEWVLGWKYDSKEEERAKELAKIEEIVKSVHFEPIAKE